MKMEPFVVSEALSSAECVMLLAHIYEQPIGEARLAGGVMHQSVRSASVSWIDTAQYSWSVSGAHLPCDVHESGVPRDVVTNLRPFAFATL